MEKYRFHSLAAAALACALGALGALGCSASVDATGGDAPNGPGSSPDAAGPGSGSDASAPTGAAGSKRGIAYGFRTAADLAALGPTVSWWYNWADKPDIVAPGPAFLPMIWGKTFDVATLDAHIPAGTEYLLTFNEPNFGDQSNVTPEQAAALWPQIQAFANRRGMKLVSPAVNYCGSPCNETDPFVWLQKFFAACTNCQVDYVGMHWYACDKPALTNTLAKYKQFGKPLWVTEISCLDTAAKVNDADELAYMKDAVDALESDPMVFRYAWFTGRSTGSPPISLLAADGKLTTLGTAYAAAPHQ